MVMDSYSEIVDKVARNDPMDEKPRVKRLKVSFINIIIIIWKSVLRNEFIRSRRRVQRRRK